MSNLDSKETNGIAASATISIHNGKEITISVEEFARLKDIETRFTVLKNQMLHAEYCPIHTQVILGIENEKAAKEFSFDSILKMDDGK